MKKKTLVSILFILCILYSCRPTLYIPASTDATKQQQLLTGRKLYVAHCSGCHNLHFPKEFDETGWQQRLGKMQVKAKINDEEKELILKYLTSQQ